MDYAVEDIITEVLTTMDRQVESTALLSSGVSLSVRDIVRKHLLDAAWQMTMEAPARMLEGEAFGTSASWESAIGIGIGAVALPDDFLRLLAFRMSDWTHAVYHIVDPDSSEWQMVSSSLLMGVRGNGARPLCTITHWATGRKLEFCGCSSGSDVSVSVAVYAKKPTITTASNIETLSMSADIKRAVVFRCAALASTTIGETDTAANFFELSKKMIQ